MILSYFLYRLHIYSNYFSYKKNKGAAPEATTQNPQIEAVVEETTQEPEVADAEEETTTGEEVTEASAE